MFINEFITNTLLQASLNDNLVKIREKYNFSLNEEVEKIISCMNFDGPIFFDDEDFFKLLSLREVIDASDDMNVDFLKHGILPIFDIGDNDFVSYDSTKREWCKFNVVDEVSSSITSSISDYFISCMSRREGRKNIIETINSLEGLLFLSPVSDADIEDAEKKLGLKLAYEYKEYVKTFGAISAKEIELTGVSTSDRLNVVFITEREREINPKISSNMYVVENTAIDGIIILQDETGAIYSIAPGIQPKKIFNSLSEYVKSRQRQQL